MIQQDYKNNVQDMSGTVETTGFSIEVNESMFQMLTSNVYNDPILAVMREWSTNACDACIAAGVKPKFDVHLPTLEESTFYVRDYGTGLPPEDIVGLFSNLGASTKRNSDAYNGTLGIGRMAGLAVADAFTVESFYNGMHYTYVISMQNGVPVTLHLGDSATNEPNGLKLSVSVEFEQIRNFDEKAGPLYKYFDHKPKLNKDIDIELDVSEHISDDWFIVNNEYSHRSSNYVVMSQVAYEIPYNSQVNDQGFKNLVIKATPGSVTFNPGRESLSLNKATINYLNTAFDRIKDEYVLQATKAISNAGTDYEIMTTYGSVVRSAPHTVAEQIDPVPFVSQKFKNLFCTPSYYHSHSKPFNYLAGTLAFKTATNNMLTLSLKNSYYKTAKPLTEDNSHNWRDFLYSAHVIIDLKSKFRSALNEMYSHKNLVTWQRTSGTDIEEATQVAKDYLDAMGIPYKLASELIDVESYEGELSNIAPREGFYVSEVTDGNIYKSEKMEESKITSRDYLCLNLKNTTPIMSEGKDFTEYMVAYTLLASAIIMPPIKGVAKKYKGFVEQLDNWLDFESYIEEKMKTMVFKKPYDTGVPTFSSRIFNKDNYTNYPKALQYYFMEVRDYHYFNNDTTFIGYERDREIAEKFGASFISYEPQYNVDMEELETMFPKTLPLINGTASRYWEPESDLVVHLAKLEEFYAIHSSDERQLYTPDYPRSVQPDPKILPL